MSFEVVLSLPLLYSPTWKDFTALGDAHKAFSIISICSELIAILIFPIFCKIPFAIGLPLQDWKGNP